MSCINEMTPKKFSQTLSDMYIDGRISDRDLDIVILRFGLLEGAEYDIPYVIARYGEVRRPMTFQELSMRYRISRQRAHQVVGLVLSRMNWFLAKKRIMSRTATSLTVVASQNARK